MDGPNGPPIITTFVVGKWRQTAVQVSSAQRRSPSSAISVR